MEDSNPFAKRGQVSRTPPQNVVEKSTQENVKITNEDTKSYQEEHFEGNNEDETIEGETRKVPIRGKREASHTDLSPTFTNNKKAKKQINEFLQTPMPSTFRVALQEESQLNKSGGLTIIEKALSVALETAKEIDNLANKVHTTTKVEIKSKSEKLHEILRKIKRNWNKETESMIKTPKNSMSTQTENLDTVDDVNDLEDRISKIDKPQDVLNIIQEKWPPRPFVKVKSVNKSILSTAPARILILSKDNKKDADIMARMSAQYPRLGTAIKTAKVGKRLKLIIKEDIQTEEDEPLQSASGEQTKTTLSLEPQLIAITILEDKDIVESTVVHLKRYLNEVEEAGLKRASFYVSQSIELQTTMKIIECCNTGNEAVDLCTKGRSKEPRKKIFKQTPDSLIVRTEAGKSYADTLKSLKSGISFTANEAHIEKISRTRSGDVRIEIKENAHEDIVNISKTIQEKTKCTTEVQRAHEARFLLHDIDDETTAEDIRKGITEQFGEVPNLQIDPPKVNQNGNWTARFSMPGFFRESIIKRKTIMIGPISCRFTERVIIPQCFNCLAIGHLGKNCTEVKSDKKKCYKCGNEQHLSKYCNENKKCFTCKTDEHVGNSWTCPVYRKLVTDKQKSLLQPKKSKSNEITSNEHALCPNKS